MKDTAPDVHLGDRIECFKSIGTVRYIGPVRGTPSTWLGIDWDCPERGKHNGTHAGDTYFSTKHPKSGSFIRPEKANRGTTIAGAIRAKYGETEDEATAKLNREKQLVLQHTMNAPFLEMVGFDKVFSKQSNFLALTVVSLREMCVSDVYGDCCLSSELGNLCPNLEELDLSKNLFSSWTQIFSVIEQLERLHWINVSENLLSLSENDTKIAFNNLHTLICGRMALNWAKVVKIADYFPNLKELRLPENEIDELQETHNMKHLKLLDLEGNPVRNWSEILKLGNMDFEYLVLENTGLNSIEFEEGNSTLKFSEMQKLSIAQNSINEWRSIDELNKLKKLKNFKILKNPIMSTADMATVHQLIIARIKNLETLNGVEIGDKERRDAEYDYLKKYGKEWLQVKTTENESKFLDSHRRYLELLQKYGEPEESELKEQSKKINSTLIELILIFDKRRVKKKLPPTITIKKLAILTQRLFQIKQSLSLEYVSCEDEKIRIKFSEELKDINHYSMKDGDMILVTIN